MIAASTDESASCLLPERDDLLHAQLYRNFALSDGSSAGIHLVIDSLPGAVGSVPSQLTDVAGTLFFMTNDWNTGDTIWKTDGSASGTVALKLVEPGPFNSSTVNGLTAVGQRLFFWDWQSLWTSDGTPAGTLLVAKVYPNQFTAVGSRVFFVGDNGELWISDGSAASTRMVKEDMWPGIGSSSPASLTAVENRLFFSASDPAHGRELWVSDGSEVGTFLVQDIAPGPEGSLPENLTLISMGNSSLAQSMRPTGVSCGSATATAPASCKTSPPARSAPIPAISG